MTVSESYIRKTVAPEASLAVAGGHHELPVRKGTLGPDVIDITTLYAETDHFTYDPSFTSTASCELKITFIDGGKGVLLYRGYPSISLPSIAPSWRPAICSCTASCRRRSSTTPSAI